MRFENWTSVAETEALQEDYSQGRKIGRLRLGRTYLFLRDKMKVRYVPYGDIRRYYRRVEEVPARLCCGRGNFLMESLMVCCGSADILQIPLPDTRSARIVMDCMAKLAPDAEVGSKPTVTS